MSKKRKIVHPMPPMDWTTADQRLIDRLTCVLEQEKVGSSTQMIALFWKLFSSGRSCEREGITDAQLQSFYSSGPVSYIGGGAGQG